MSYVHHQFILRNVFPILWEAPFPQVVVSVQKQIQTVNHLDIVTRYGVDANPRVIVDDQRFLVISVLVEDELHLSSGKADFSARMTRRHTE